MKPLRVLLADDHELVRAGIRMLLHTLDYVEVVAEAGDGTGALELARKHRPDIVLMDLSMKKLSGLDATAQLSRELPEVRVIVLSMHADNQHVQQALKNGARGYLLKDSATLELDFALKAIAKGDTYLSPAVSSAVIDNYLQQNENDSGPLSVLTPRQREILKLIAEGRTTRDIAGQLKLSVKTVESHRAQLMERLDVYDVAGLVRLAIHAGLIKAEN